MHLSAILVPLLANQPLNADALRTLLSQATTTVGEEILVGAPGRDAEKELYFVTSLPSARTRLIRVEPLGDADLVMTRALAEAGLRCAFRAEAAGIDAWRVTAHGDCRSRAEKTATSAPDAELRPTPQPDGGPQATAVDARPARDAALRKYKSQRLIRDRLQYAVGYVGGSGGNVHGSVNTVTTWTVYDGGGAPYNPRSFAAAVGDGAMRARLEQRKQSVVTASVGFGALAVGGLAYALHDTSRPDGGNGMAAMVVSGVGITGLLTVVLNEGVKQRSVSGFYTPPEADRWIDAYNARLRDSLGLTSEDTRELDLAP
jgi:hypothetical protein